MFVNPKFCYDAGDFVVFPQTLLKLCTQQNGSTKSIQWVFPCKDVICAPCFDTRVIPVVFTLRPCDIWIEAAAERRNADFSIAVSTDTLLNAGQGEEHNTRHTAHEDCLVSEGQMSQSQHCHRRHLFCFASLLGNITICVRVQWTCCTQIIPDIENEAADVRLRFIGWTIWKTLALHRWPSLKPPEPQPLHLWFPGEQQPFPG